MWKWCEIPASKETLWFILPKSISIPNFFAALPRIAPIAKQNGAYPENNSRFSTTKRPQMNDKNRPEAMKWKTSKHNQTQCHETQCH